MSKNTLRTHVQFLPLICLIVCCSISVNPLVAATGIASIGQQITLSVTASGPAPFSYQWTKNSIDVPGANSASYVLGSAKLSDSGVYVCRVANVAGATYSDIATLVVNPLISLPAAAPASSPPRITTQPASQTLTAGGTVLFNVVATGSPAPTYQWRKNGTDIPGATSASYRVSPVSALHNGAYTAVVTNSSGSVTSTGAQLSILPAVRWSTAGSDFNRDGYSDLLWQNKVTTEGMIGLMATTVLNKATATLLSNTISLGKVAANWEMRGTSDFNGDGSPDILWQNTVTGEGSIWLMTGTTHTGTALLNTVTTDWVIVGAADLNGDEWPDIILQNKVTGAGQVWLMAGTAVASVAVLDTLSPEWRIRGTGDFNADHKSDLLVQSKTTGETQIWLMTGLTRNSSVSLGAQSVDWVVHGSVDFNRDGKTDLIWQNVKTGETRLWLMNGTVNGSIVPFGTLPPEWVFWN